MSSIKLYNGCSNANTMVSNQFIDEYMLKANGEFVKVYLYLLRCMGTAGDGISIPGLADRMEMTEKDILRAIRYWEQKDFLQLECEKDGTILSIRMHQPGEAYNASKPDTPAISMYQRESSANIAQPDAPAIREYSATEILSFRQNSEISELFYIIETYFKHPLGNTDMNTVLYWYDTLKLPQDLIIYLVEYNISKGHSSIRYMNKVALSWANRNIRTIAAAKADAAVHTRHYYSVMKALGITGRNLTDPETAYITKWTQKYSFDLDMIQEACRRTISATHQPSFEYTDSILTTWHKKNARTIKDVEKLDTEYSKTKKSVDSPAFASSGKKNRFHNFNQRDYDYEQLERVLLTTTVHSD